MEQVILKPQSDIRTAKSDIFSQLGVIVNFFDKSGNPASDSEILQTISNKSYMSSDFFFYDFATIEDITKRFYDYCGLKVIIYTPEGTQPEKKMTLKDYREKYPAVSHPEKEEIIQETKPAIVSEIQITNVEDKKTADKFDSISKLKERQKLAFSFSDYLKLAEDVFKQTADSTWTEELYLKAKEKIVFVSDYEPFIKSIVTNYRDNNFATQMLVKATDKFTFSSDKEVLAKIATEVLNNKELSIQIQPQKDLLTEIKSQQTDNEKLFIEEIKSEVIDEKIELKEPEEKQTKKELVETIFKVVEKKESLENQKSMQIHPKEATAKTPGDKFKYLKDMEKQADSFLDLKNHAINIINYSNDKYWAAEICRQAESKAYYNEDFKELADIVKTKLSDSNWSSELNKKASNAPKINQDLENYKDDEDFEDEVVDEDEFEEEDTKIEDKQKGRYQASQYNRSHQTSEKKKDSVSKGCGFTIALLLFLYFLIINLCD